jgi:hypothetical protein
MGAVSRQLSTFSASPAMINPLSRRVIDQLMARGDGSESIAGAEPSGTSLAGSLTRQTAGDGSVNEVKNASSEFIVVALYG